MTQGLRTHFSIQSPTVIYLGPSPIPPLALSQVAATAGRTDARTNLALAAWWRWAMAFLKPIPDESIHESESGTLTKARAKRTSTKECEVPALAYVLGRLTELSQQPQ